MGALAARRLAALAPGHPALGLLEAGLAQVPFAEVPGLAKGWTGLPGGLGQGVPAAGRGAHPALAVAELMDGGDLFRAVAASFRMALTLFADHGAWAVGLEDLEADQRDDAAMRLVLLSLLAWRLFPGAPEARAQALLGHATGRALLGWIAAVDLALAFGMEDEPLPSDLLPAVLGPHAEEAFEALASAVPAAELTGARRVLAALVAPATALVEACNARIALIAEALALALPALPEHTSEAMAAEVEATPTYLALAARLLVEAGQGEAATSPGPEPAKGAAGGGAQRPERGGSAAEAPRARPEPAPKATEGPRKALMASLTARRTALAEGERQADGARAALQVARRRLAAVQAPPRAPRASPRLAALEAALAKTREAESVWSLAQRRAHEALAKAERSLAVAASRLDQRRDVRGRASERLELAQAALTRATQARDARAAARGPLHEALAAAEVALDALQAEQHGVDLQRAEILRAQRDALGERSRRTGRQAEGMGVRYASATARLAILQAAAPEKGDETAFVSLSAAFAQAQADHVDHAARRSHHAEVLAKAEARWRRSREQADAVRAAHQCARDAARQAETEAVDAERGLTAARAAAPAARVALAAARAALSALERDLEGAIADRAAALVRRAALCAQRDALRLRLDLSAPDEARLEAELAQLRAQGATLAAAAPAASLAGLGAWIADLETRLRGDRATASALEERGAALAAARSTGAADLPTRARAFSTAATRLAGLRQQVGAAAEVHASAAARQRAAVAARDASHATLAGAVACLAGLEAALRERLAALAAARESLRERLAAGRIAVASAAADHEVQCQRRQAVERHRGVLRAEAGRRSADAAALAPRLLALEAALQAAPARIAAFDERRDALAFRLADAVTGCDLRHAQAQANAAASAAAARALADYQEDISELRDEHDLMREAVRAAQALVAEAATELESREQALAAVLAQRRDRAVALRAQRSELCLGVRALQERTAALETDHTAAARQGEKLRAKAGKQDAALRRLETVVEYNARGLREARGQVAAEAARRDGQVRALAEAEASLPGLHEALAARRLAVPAAREAVTRAEEAEVEADERVARREGRVRRSKRMNGLLQADLDASLRERAERFPELALRAAARAERRRALEAARARRDAIEARLKDLQAQLEARYAAIQTLRAEGGRLARSFPEVGRAVAVQRRKVADLRARQTPGSVCGPDPLVAAADQARARATRVHARWRVHVEELRATAEQAERVAIAADQDLALAQERARSTTHALAHARSHLARLRSHQGLTTSTDSAGLPTPPPPPPSAPPPPPPRPPRPPPDKAAQEEYVFVPFREPAPAAPPAGTGRRAPRSGGGEPPKR